MDQTDSNCTGKYNFYYKHIDKGVTLIIKDSSQKKKGCPTKHLVPINDDISGNIQAETL